MAQKLILKKKDAVTYKDMLGTVTELQKKGGSDAYVIKTRQGSFHVLADDANLKKGW